MFVGREMAKQPVQQENEIAEPETKNCGIIMPIAPMLPEYDAQHWTRVKDILSDAIAEAGYSPRLVSDSDEVGVIHGQIVQNLYDDEIVVCDVSGKNPNVMFELGLRLAFDKPTVVVKDDITAYSFDTSPIKHIGYRKDQRFDDVKEFKDKVTNAIKGTIAKKEGNPDFSPFLKHFGHFTPKQVENQELPQAEFIMKKLSDIEKTMARVASHALRNETDPFTRWRREYPDEFIPTANELAILDEIQTHILANFRKGVPPEIASNKQIKTNLKRQIFLDMMSRGIHEDRFDELFDRVWNIESRGR